MPSTVFGLSRQFPTNKGPMGFAFAPDGKRFYLCCHDDAVANSSWRAEKQRKAFPPRPAANSLSPIIDKISPCGFFLPEQRARSGGD
jgi:hypothetical protein